MCEKYKQSNNINNTEHWEQQIKSIADNNYSIIKIEDFCGVREII